MCFQYKEVIRYDPKRVQIIEFPARRIESEKCQHWFPLGRGNATKEKKQAPELLRQECLQYLQASVQRLSSVIPEEKVQHQQADAFYPMKYLSPQFAAKKDEH